MAYLVAFEDELAVATLLEYSLKNFGHSVDIFPNGCDDSLKKLLLLKNNPDLFLLDFNMPGRNGLEVLTLIRTDTAYHRFSDVPVMGIGDFPKDQRSGLVDCYPKTWALRDLNNRINVALQNRTG
mgnify:CR=1 FL=1